MEAAASAAAAAVGGGWSAPSTAHGARQYEGPVWNLEGKVLSRGHQARCVGGLPARHSTAHSGCDTGLVQCKTSVAAARRPPAATMEGARPGAMDGWLAPTHLWRDTQQGTPVQRHSRQASAGGHRWTGPVDRSPEARR